MQRAAAAFGNAPGDGQAQAAAGAAAGALAPKALAGAFAILRAHAGAGDRARLVAVLAEPVPQDRSIDLKLAREHATASAVYAERMRVFIRTHVNRVLNTVEGRALAETSAVLMSKSADPSLAEQLLGWRAQRDVSAMCQDAWRWQSSAARNAA